MNSSLLFPRGTSVLHYGRKVRMIQIDFDRFGKPIIAMDD